MYKKLIFRHNYRLFRNKYLKSKVNSDLNNIKSKFKTNNNWYKFNKNNNKMINNNNNIKYSKNSNKTRFKRNKYSFVKLENNTENCLKPEVKQKIIEFNNRLRNNSISNKSNYFINNFHNYYLDSKLKTKNNYSNRKALKSKVSIIGGIAYRVTRNSMRKKSDAKPVLKPKINPMPVKEVVNCNNHSNDIQKETINGVKDVSNDSIVEKNSPKKKILIVRGIKYEMDLKGKSLRQVADNGSAGKVGNKSRIDIGGLTYRYSKPGLFVSTNAEVVRQLRNRAIKSSINRILLAKRNKCYLKKMPKKHCIFYCRFGRCMKGVNCPFIHDKDKIAVCSRFIRGTCRAEDCTFSHMVAPEKMPVCSYFLQGRCGSDNCPYRHVKVSSDAQICKDFLCGYCPKGIQCKSAHIFVCIDYNRSGKCPKGDLCPLPHNRIGVKLNNKKKRKISMTLKSAKIPKQFSDTNYYSLSQSLPQFIPLFVDNNHIESDNKSPQNVVEIDTNSNQLPKVRRKEKIKYFWTESDDENSHMNSESDDNEETARRPSVRIVPNFLS